MQGAEFRNKQWAVATDGVSKLCTLMHFRMFDRTPILCSDIVETAWSTGLFPRSIKYSTPPLHEHIVGSLFRM